MVDWRSGEWVVNRLAGEEKCEASGNRKPHPVLTLAIILLLIFLVVIPGFLLILGLCQAAAFRMPRPRCTTSIDRPSHAHLIVGRTQTWHNRDTMRRRLARANYN